MKNIRQFFVVSCMACLLGSAAMTTPAAGASTTDELANLSTAQIEARIKQLELERMALLQAEENSHSGKLQLPEAMLLIILLGSYALALKQLIGSSPATSKPIGQDARSEIPVIETWERTIIIAPCPDTIIPVPAKPSRPPQGWVGHHLANDNNLLIDLQRATASLGCQATTGQPAPPVRHAGLDAADQSHPAWQWRDCRTE